MQELIVDLLIVPMPVLWLLLLALVLWRWRGLAGALVLLATLLFAVLSIPAIGQLLLAPLAQAAPPYDSQAESAPRAIVVPTAGAFPDGSGRWWPSEGSVLRAVAGRKLQRDLDLPLILAGGAPLPGEPSEAVVTAEALALVGPDVRFETTARNSAETAEALAALLEKDAASAAEKSGVILVTSPSHVARMSAALRHQGIAVYKAPVVDPRETAKDREWSALDFLPSDRGLKLSRAALWEYMGIGWYLLTGRIDAVDLLP